MKFIACLLFSLFFYCAKSEDLPSYLKPCNVQDSAKALEECIEKQMKLHGKTFAKGVPELGLPPLDPVDLEDIHLDGNGLNLAITKPKMYGLSEITIKSISLDIKRGTYVMQIQGDLKLTGKYEVDGRVLILPVQGNGDATVMAKNVTLTISASLGMNNKKDHLTLKNPSYNYTITKTVFKFENLFNGNKEVSDVTHKFVNENWQQVMDEMAPPAIQQIVKTCINTISRFFAKVPIAKLFTGDIPDVAWS